MSRFPVWLRYASAASLFALAHLLRGMGGLLLSRVSKPSEVVIAFLVVVLGIKLMILGYFPIRTLRYEVVYRGAVYLMLLILIGWGLAVGFRTLLAMTESVYLPGPGIPEEVPTIGIAAVCIANLVYFWKKYGFARHPKGDQQAKATSTN